MPRRLVAFAFLLLACCPALAGAAPQASASTKDVPAPYRSTRDQAGHELVKTEEFIVPLKTPIVVRGLEFESAACTLTALHQRILAQVFNSIEEITENTVNDTDQARVAVHKRMKFEIRGHSSLAGNRRKDRTLARNCAKVVMDYLTRLGTPSWRLEAKGRGDAGSMPGITVDFVRTR